MTLLDLVDRGTFDPGSGRHRRALDESGPLADPELEAARSYAQSLRRDRHARVRAAEAMARFARLVAGRRKQDDDLAPQRTSRVW